MPQTYFPEGFHLNGACIVNIQISEWPWDYCSKDQGAWQVAHECVHLLDPMLKGTNVLEEGLATWFQNEPEHHIAIVRRYINRLDSKWAENYLEAENLVRKCMPQIIPAVKEIRSEGVKIRDISPERLALLLPNVSSEKIEQLCTRFR